MGILGHLSLCSFGFCYARISRGKIRLIWNDKKARSPSFLSEVCRIVVVVGTLFSLPALHGVQNSAATLTAEFYEVRKIIEPVFIEFGQEVS
jgi:hypothetical protein